MIGSVSNKFYRPLGFIQTYNLNCFINVKYQQLLCLYMYLHIERLDVVLYVKIYSCSLNMCLKKSLKKKPCNIF